MTEAVVAYGKKIKTSKGAKPAKIKTGPGSGGRRLGAGRKPGPGKGSLADRLRDKEL